MDDREVLNDEEKNEIINYTINNYNNFLFNNNNNGYYIHPNMINDDKITSIIKKIEERIIKKENLHNYPKNDDLDDFLYYMDSGTKLHLHKDPNDNNGIHVRFNVCIQKPEYGGYPVYSGKTIDIKEKCYIICRAGLDYHTGGLIRGNKAKIVLSFGFSINEDHVKNYTNRDKIIKKII